VHLRADRSGFSLYRCGRDHAPPLCLYLISRFRFRYAWLEQGRGAKVTEVMKVVGCS